MWYRSWILSSCKGKSLMRPEDSELRASCCGWSMNWTEGDQYNLRNIDLARFLLENTFRYACFYESMFLVVVASTAKLSPFFRHYETSSEIEKHNIWEQFELLVQSVLCGFQINLSGHYYGKWFNRRSLKNNASRLVKVKVVFNASLQQTLPSNRLH